MDSGRVVTHYDNLKVARNAPVEVIRAAYRTLAQQFHPDRFPDQAVAERRMQIINQAYAVLSDPDQRRAHDVWIAEQEALQAMEESLRPSARARESTPAHDGTHETKFGNAGRSRAEAAGGGFSALLTGALRLALFGGALWLVYLWAVEKPAEPVTPPASAGRVVPPQHVEGPGAKASTSDAPSFAHASRCFWVYAPIAQAGRDLPHPELLRFGQERLKWYDAYFKRNKGSPEFRQAFENSRVRYEASGSDLYKSLVESLATENPKKFTAAIDAAVTCDRLLGIRTPYVPKM
ncbi:MAG: J domain-containing protein [Burkholderiales bacterium]